MRKFIFCMLSIFIVLALASSVHASKVAMVVKDKASLNEEHEKRIKDILTDMGHEITLVDKNVNVNYENFDLIVVAGRPLFSSSKLLDSFVANIPVNDVPTIGIDFVYLDDWGWIRSNGASSLTRSDRQNVIIQVDHPLVKGFNVGDKKYVHLIPGTNTVDIIKNRTKLNFVATADTDGDLGLLAYALPNTQLYNNKVVSSDSAIVFFGITYPLYWTSEAVSLFKNSVNWLTNDTDQDGIKDFLDNCYSIPNPDQSDTDQDRIGDICDPEDNRPDLIVTGIDLPEVKIECDDLNVDVTIKNIGFGSATGYTVELEIDGVIYESRITSPLGINQINTVSFTILGEDICGVNKNVLNAAIRYVQPAELDNLNNHLTKKFIFTILKMDVDDDGIQESAIDKNKNITDGYEVYFDQNNNSNALAFFGDLDKKTDYLIDVGKNGIYEKYWDPDDNILVNVTYNGTDQILIDLNSNGSPDIIYNITSKKVDYLDKKLPSVGEIVVTPTYNGKTWVLFNISAEVTDSESGINENSCEYTLDGTNWDTAHFSNGRCYKNSLTSSIGTILSINIRVKDRIGNLGTGASISKLIDIRPLRITVNLDSSSYSPNSTAQVSGEVRYNDNGERVGNAIVKYYLSNTYISGIITTDSNGRYSLNFKVPSAYGTYTLIVEATSSFAKGSNSATVNIPTPSIPSGAYVPQFPVMLTEIPSNITAYEGTDSEFSIVVRNGGTTILNNVNVNINFTQFSIDIFPESVTLPAGESETFEVTLHIPENFTGEYTSVVKVSSQEIATEKNLYLTVLEKKLPLLTISEMIIPDFHVNTTATVGIKIKNSGNIKTETTVSVDLPPGWKATDEETTFQIEPNTTAVVYFQIIPSNESGTISFVTSYELEGKPISIINSTEVTVFEERELTKPKSITGRIVEALSDPKIAILATLWVIVICSIIAWLLRSTSPRIAQSKSKKTSFSYKDWESKHKKNHKIFRFLL
ncbi:MAG: CARDB domain-containing protein [Candidatus Aenigmatarchaeota archaeon]